MHPLDPLTPHLGRYHAADSAGVCPTGRAVRYHETLTLRRVGDVVWLDHVATEHDGGLLHEEHLLLQVRPDGLQYAGVMNSGRMEVGTATLTDRVLTLESRQILNDRRGVQGTRRTMTFEEDTCHRALHLAAGRWPQLTRHMWGRLAREPGWCLQPMSRTDAAAIAGWQYRPPYDLYSHPKAHRAAVIEDLLAPENAYEAIYRSGRLAAFWCCGPDARVSGGDYTVPAADIGLGLRPDLTGQGLGGTLVAAVLDRVRSHPPPLPMRVTIAARNARAVRVWEKQGFAVTQRFVRASDGREFVVMCREP